MQRWHSPWIVCITPPPPSLPPPPPSPVFKSAASTHTLRRWLSTWPAPLQPEYLHSFLCAAECVLLGLCCDGWVDLRVLWIISTAAQRVGGSSLAVSKMSDFQVTAQLMWLQTTLFCLTLLGKRGRDLSSIIRMVLGGFFFSSWTGLHSASTFPKWV